jgi:Protein of unknown function (DUF551)
MSRCQHCKKLTHSEHLKVYFKEEDFEKIQELTSLEKWTPKYLYPKDELHKSLPEEYGMLKCGDIYIHFIMSKSDRIEWISVKDRLPKPLIDSIYSQSVIAMNIEDGHIFVATFVENENSWYDDSDRDLICGYIDPITHWMELPELPK